MFLPTKVLGYLRRLRSNYIATAEPLLAEMIGSARCYVREQTSYDNWNGGTYGHDVVLFLPSALFDKIPLNLEEELRAKLCSDLNSCAQSVTNENIDSVVLELADQEDPEFQKSRVVIGVPPVAPESVSFWKPGLIRVFVSHRDSEKVDARAFGRELEKYGISTFVAHDTIEPMSSWRDEILKGLQTMEVLVALVSEGYDESVWTNQEVGFALGKDVPVIAIQAGARAPSGFLAATQALKGSLSDPNRLAAETYQILCDKLGNRERLLGALIAAFVESSDFDETRRRFDLLNQTVSSLSNSELKNISDAFSANEYLRKAFYLGHSDRLEKFLNRTTGRRFEVDFKNGIIKERP